MKIVCGLGNPGIKYEKTRHNIGFLFVDFLQENGNFSDFQEEKKFKSYVASGTLNGEKVLLVKPQTFMNVSGEAVVKILHFYKLDIKEDFVVIYDDVSMEFGKVRFREKGSAGGQNGIKNIILHCGDVFSRIKIWVWNNPQYNLSDRVVSKFSFEEEKQFDEIFKKAQGYLA